MLDNKEEMVIEWNNCCYADILEEVKDDEDFMAELKSQGLCECKIAKAIESETDWRYQMYWDDNMRYLTEVMNDINKRNYDWYCKTRNNGWRRRNGYKKFEAKNGQSLLSQLLPSDSSFTIKRHGNMLIINASHHDSPCGGEMYYIIGSNNCGW